MEMTRLPDLRRYILDEIFAAFGFQDRPVLRSVLTPLFWPPAQIFARIAASFEQDVVQFGLPEAARRLLPRFVKGVQARGVERIPIEGPLLIASNHPGAYDSVVIASLIPRQDVKIVVSDIPFFRRLPALNERMIYTRRGVDGRMAAFRGMIRHLREGGAALIFPSGLVDPDPDILPGASQKLAEWSRSLELAMQRVPETRLLTTIVSGVLSPRCLRTPLARLQKEPWRQRKLAEFIQVIQQLVFQRDYHLSPRVSFGAPLNAAQLRAGRDSTDLMQLIVEHAQATLTEHMRPAEQLPSTSLN
ncbi:MAG: 1-acyl-sn-glycerol-3-phosphate acyltransferase [Anaerolineales bacterium]|nr:1-acyl-sn-glycerol-3-phosphate acyltransferase [Anaerolineales bacterium]